MCVRNEWGSWCTLVLAVVLSSSLGACNDERQVARDGAVGDRAIGDRAISDRGTVDQGAHHDLAVEGRPRDLALDLTTIDLRPDGPRPPPHWKELKGAPEGEGHTATLLANGEVLIVGGHYKSTDGQNETYEKRAWRYLPTTDTFDPAGEMKTARAYHKATRLSDGRVLVTGGENDVDWLASVEIFDPQKPVATAWSTAVDLPESRSEHTAVLLPQGKVLVTGGHGSSPNASMATLLLYDPQTNSWTASAQLLKEARRGHTATLLPNGKVFIAGGYTGSSPSKYVWLASTELYDPATSKVTLLPPMSEKRTGHTATLLLDGRVLIVGGYCENCLGKSVDDLYDPAKDTMTPIAHLGVLPSGHAAPLLLDGRTLVLGSWQEPAAVLAFDPTLFNWARLPDLVKPRAHPTATTLKDGTVLVVGGEVSTGPYVYAPAERFFP